MATFLSRRAALAAATGAGAAVALTACASDIRPLADSSSSPSGEASPSASASESASASASASAADSGKKSYKGTVKLDKYEKNGEYVPATAEKKAQNVPKPVVPEKMNEATIEGMYEFLSYWVASFNYMFMTGDYEPLKKADPAGEFANDHNNVVLVYSTGKGWVYDTDAPVTVQLLTDAPKKVAGGPNRYDWIGRFIQDPKAKLHVEGQDPIPLAEEGSSKSEATNFAMDYKDGSWFMVSEEDSSDVDSSKKSESKD
ncbi:hypothetical protein HMPREF0737_01115 [Rothia mucilaginosa M508]|uniref:DUF6318 domain-containing protein n=1 Tax=Rothia mucilaginosa M508 TaxID=563033 RepID=G5ES55_9MICC|nr:DUF6318 family protein [Rothia mucilaginosa]EHB87992.1 hypothetical protein HMPREF0737_01115 [Rothia mucilaginosa M508]